ATPNAAAQEDYVKKEARERFQEGTALMNEGKYEQARAKFVQAYAAAKVPNVVFNLARSEHLTGRFLDAGRHYREYLRIADAKKLTTKERADVEGWLAETNKHIGHLEITAPNGGHVLVDGERVGDAPLGDTVDVAVGKHAVLCEVEGKRLVAEIDAAPGVT